MRIFAAKFLEKPSLEQTLSPEDWNWKPANKNAVKIYASGAATSTRSSTYAAEKDERADHDRPNEGLYIA